MTQYWKYDDNYPAFMHAKAIIEYHAKSFAFASNFYPNIRDGLHGVFIRFADMRIIS